MRRVFCGYLGLKITRIASLKELPSCEDCGRPSVVYGLSVTAGGYYEHHIRCSVGKLNHLSKGVHAADYCMEGHRHGMECRLPQGDKCYEVQLPDTWWQIIYAHQEDEEGVKYGPSLS